MLRHFTQCIKHYSTKPISNTQTKEKWDLITAICLERKPIITKKLKPIEQQYQTFLSQIEFERSLKSDHEVRHEKELVQIEQMKRGDDVDVHIKETAQEQVDACTEELNNFKLGRRTTEADEKNDLQSLNRRLDGHLVLVQKQKVGNEEFYLLPQGNRLDGETLRQAANRVLKETCGEDIKALIYGNAPTSVYKYKYPKEKRDNAVGAKVFIYFARYQTGQVEKKVDFKWLNRAELDETLPKGYKSSVLNMLIDE